MLHALVALFVLALEQIHANSIVLAYAPSLSLKSPFNDLSTRFITSGDLDATEDSLRLGHTRPHSRAAVWSRQPNAFPEWQVTLQLRITGDADTGTEGLAFWYARNAGQTGPVYGGPNKWTGLGVFVDVFDNDGKGNNPAIMGALSNGDVEWAMEKDGEGQYFGGCIRNVRNSAVPLHMRITYINRIIKVEIDDQKEGKEFMSCLERGNTDLPPGYFFGFSASTGDTPDSFELLSFEVFQLRKEQGESVSEHASSRNVANNDNQIPEEITKLRQQQSMMQSNLNAVIGQVRPGDRNLIQRFDHIDNELRSIGERIRALTDLLTKVVSKSAAVDPAALLHTLHDIRDRTDRQLKQMEATRSQIPPPAPHPYATITQPYLGYVAFVLLQIFLLTAFLTIRRRFGEKSKKFI